VIPCDSEIIQKVPTGTLIRNHVVRVEVQAWSVELKAAASVGNERPVVTSNARAVSRDQSGDRRQRPHTRYPRKPPQSVETRRFRIGVRGG
jgi:hypothetical protein